MDDLLTAHRSLLERFRRTMNLVGPGDLDQHYVDSDRALAFLEPVGRWVDLGSGAGFPGIVLAAKFPQLTVELVESRRKRCVFLSEVLAAGGSPPGVSVVCVRAETLEPAVYDGVVARAFAPPVQVLAHASRLLVDGGTLVLFLQGDATVPEQEGFTVFHVEHYEVGDRQRKAVGMTWAAASTP